MKPLPIRFRLTLWYFAMFAAAALLLSLGSRWMLRRTLDATVRQDLQERIDDVAAQLKQFDANRAPEKAGAKFRDFYQDRDDGKWLQILDENGHWMYRSPRMLAAGQSAPLPRSFARAGQSAPKGKIDNFVQGTHHVRALSVPVVVDGHGYTVQSGISMKKPNALLHDFSLGLLLLTPALLLPAAIGGHFMGRKALAPVAAIAMESRRITDRNLDRRLPVSPTNDELSHLSTTLNNMLERIDVSFRSVRDFTANASHELRTPLARLRTEAEIALMRPRETGAYRQALEHIHQDAIEMSGLVEDLLSLARAEAGSEVLRLTPTDLGSIVHEAALEWAPIADRLRIDLRKSVLEHRAGKTIVYGDRTSLVRLLRILLDNACKFTPAGGSIAIMVLPERYSVLLRVEDTGRGIAPEHQGRVFDRFYRGDADAEARSSGAGLGLSLAAWIAEQHKTNIELESAPGRGSRFTIRLRGAEQNKAETPRFAPQGEVNRS